MTVIAWIGLGNMGSRMSTRLVDAGHEVRGVDPSAAACERAAAAGVQIAATVAEAVIGAEAVVTMLPSDAEVRQVYAGGEGIWANARHDAILWDSSTVDIETSRWCHRESEEREFAFVDAPVSGGVVGAAAGTLSYLLGGAPADVVRVEALVAPLAAKVFFTGGPGTGVAAKLANNLMLLVAQQASAEGSQLAERLGLDPRVFWEVVSASSGQSWAQEHFYPVPGVVPEAAANHNFAPGFSAHLARKDLSFAVAAGEREGVRLPAAKAALVQLNRLILEGHGAKDSSLVALYSAPGERLAGYDPRAD